jgi:hypothetical protein
VPCFRIFTGIWASGNISSSSGGNRAFQRFREAGRDDLGHAAVPGVTGVTAFALQAGHALAIRWPQRVVLKQPAKEFWMSKFAIGEQVDNAADNHEGGTIIAVFPTVEGNFRYAVDTEGYGALKFFNEERLVRHLH